MEDTTAPVNTQANTINKSSTTQTENSLAVAPFEETLFVPCANGGAGEQVSLTGSIHFVYQMFWTDRGFSLVYHDNSQGVTGVGLTSGETFTGSEGTQGTVSAVWENDQWIGTTIQQMRITGRTASYVIKYKRQVVITPDGKVTVNIKEKTVDCDSK